MATVWNPADLTNITLSSTNHIAAGQFNANGGVRAAPTVHATGKWYFELSGITVDGAVNLGTENGGAALVGAGDISIDVGGNFHYPAGTTSTGGGSPAGHTVCFAIDLDNLLAWVRYDGGAWVGNGVGAGVPSSGTNGGSLATITTPQAIHAFLQGTAGGPPHGTCTINAGDSAFAQAVPSGFTGWDSPAVFPYVQSKVIF